MPMCKYVSDNKSINKDNIYGGTCANKIALLLSNKQQKLQVTSYEVPTYLASFEYYHKTVYNK
jgi:hypothetical protein